MTETREPSQQHYRPIPCATYSDYEVAILHRRKLQLRWVEANVIHEETVTPIDLHTREHQEFLVCRTGSGAEICIRLDHIRHAEVC
jgi:Rho-binding antiterminator